MFGRIFGRGKDDRDQAVCAECGRTLLAGEWTQMVIDERGEERLVCSLCGQAYAGTGEPVAATTTPANEGRMRETRTDAPSGVLEPAIEPEVDDRAESDAFWQALKEKDAEIEDLKARLARAEAERQELAGRFARLGAEDAPEPGSLTGDSSEPGERTWGETPAEFAAELRESVALQASQPEEQVEEEHSADAAPDPEPVPATVTDAGAEEDVAPVSVEQIAPAAPAPPIATETPAEAEEEAPPEMPADKPGDEPENTQPIEAVSEETLEDEEECAATGEITAAVAAASTTGDDAGTGEIQMEQSAAQAAAVEEAAASLTLLQRGVDLLNVSRVPRKIAETNGQLGLPHVHAAFDGEIITVTFMWTMGWYRFRVDLDSGDVGMDDRGYEDLTLPPNAGVRADGTVQLAPARISRAGAQRSQEPPETKPAPSRPVAEPSTPREAAEKPPEFLSKSLLGQRSDDEKSSWEQTKARDFDWER